LIEGSLKILQAFSFLSLPYGGGTVDYLYRLSRALARKGHEVTIYTGDCELDQDYINSLANVKVKVLHSWLNLHAFYIMPSILKLDIRGFDVVHLHCYRSFQNAVICHKARKHNIPYIIDAHGSTVDLKGKKQVIRGLYDLVFGYKSLENASRIIAESEVGVAEYRKLGVNSDKITLMHPLLDTEEFDVLPQVGYFRNKYNIKEQFIVLCLGRIHWAKGIEVLIDAVYQLNRQDICLVMVGQDDGFRMTLEKRAIERGILNKVLFTGFLTGADKLSALVDANVLAQPSKNEAGARPSLEAILCDTPIIVTGNTGAGKEIASFDGGYLVGYGNAKELSDTIQYILGHPNEAEVKTKKAKDFIKANLSFGKQVGKYEELYKEVME